MVTLGRREFSAPLWLWGALPLAFIAYGFARHGILIAESSWPSASGGYFRQIWLSASVFFSGFLFVDVARRSRVPWYGLLIAYFACSALATLLVSMWLAGRMQWTLMAVGFGFAFFRDSGPLIVLVLPFLAAIPLAFVLTITIRVLTGLPLISNEAIAEFRTHALAWVLWILIAMLGLAVANAFFDKHSQAAVAWGAGLAASAVYMLFVHWKRPPMLPPGQKFRTWLGAVLCLLPLLYSPYALLIGDPLDIGRFAARPFYDSLRALRVLPTPKPPAAPRPTEPPANSTAAPR